MSTKQAPPDPTTLDSVEFARKFLRNPDGSPLVPHDGQIELLRNIKNLTVACCGRQWGKSVAMSVHATWFACTHAHRQIYIIAPTLDQSRIIFNEIANHFRGELLSPLVDGKITEYPFPRIKLANGTEIHGRGANSPQFLRGKKCHLAVVDEAAFCKDSTITDVIEPFFTVTGKTKDAAMILISTPFGLGAFQDFAKAAQKDTKGKASYHHFPSSSNPHADKEFLDRVKARYGEDSLSWRTEYLAEFVDDDMAVFPASVIKWSYEHYPYTEGEAEKPRFPVPPQESHKYVSGVDLANVRDFFVQTVLDVTDPHAVLLVHMTRKQKLGYTQYKRMIRHTRKTYNKAKTLIDATSLGESVVEDLSDIEAEGFKFSQQSKYEIVQELSRMFAEQRLLIPYDPDIISELRNFTYEITKSKGLRMEAKTGHDDIVMSLALAAHLALMPHFIGLFATFDFDPPRITAKKPTKRPKQCPSPDEYIDPFKDDD